MRDLNGLCGWVTGAGSGIGKTAAERLAAEGLTVVLSGRRLEPLEGAAQSIRAAGGTAEIKPLDVADRAAVSEAGAWIADRFGRIDLLLNNAGLNIRKRAWQDLSAEDWNLVVDVDLNGAFHCCQAVLPAMRRQKDGLIINVSSWAGVYPTKLTGPAYAAAKHGLVAMNESLNMEEGVNGIRACVLCPAEVNTAILDARPQPPTRAERARMLQLEDLGETIAFLAKLPTRVCVNSLVVSPTWNRVYIDETHPGHHQGGPLVRGEGYR